MKLKPHLVAEVYDLTGLTTRLPTSLPSVVYCGRQDIVTKAFWNALPTQNWELGTTTFHARLAKLSASLRLTEEILDALGIGVEAETAGIRHLIHLGAHWPKLQVKLGASIVATSGPPDTLAGMIRDPKYGAIYDMIPREREVSEGTWLMFSLS
jgi:hypothetical protein